MASAGEQRRLSAHRLVLAGRDGDMEIQRASPIERVGFSPCGDLLVTEGRYDQVEVWSVSSGTCLGAFPGAGGIGATAGSADGALLAIGTLGQGGSGSIRPISIWGIVEQRELYELLGHIHQVHSLAFSRDGRWLVSASLDRTVRLWSLDVDAAMEPQETAQLAYGDLEFASLHVLSDGCILVFRRSCLEIWRELLVRVPAPHPFDCRWQLTRSQSLLIGNNRGGVNGWVGPHAIYGIAVNIEP